MAHPEPVWEVDGRAVTQAAFAAFLATLTEVPHTWYCDETDTGGSTGYEATDAAGTRWVYEAVSEPDEQRSTIARASADPLGL